MKATTPESGGGKRTVYVSEASKPLVEYYGRMNDEELAKNIKETKELASRNSDAIINVCDGADEKSWYSSVSEKGRKNFEKLCCEVIDLLCPFYTTTWFMLLCIGAGVLIVLLVIAIVVLVLIRKKKKGGAVGSGKSVQEVEKK